MICQLLAHAVGCTLGDPKMAPWKANFREILSRSARRGYSLINPLQRITRVNGTSSQHRLSAQVVPLVATCFPVSGMGCLSAFKIAITAN